MLKIVITEISYSLAMIYRLMCITLYLIRPYYIAFFQLTLKFWYAFRYIFVNVRVNRFQYGRSHLSSCNAGKVLATRKWSLVLMAYMRWCNVCVLLFKAWKCSAKARFNDRVPILWTIWSWEERKKKHALAWFLKYRIMYIIFIYTFI